MHVRVSNNTNIRVSWKSCETLVSDSGTDTVQPTTTSVKCQRTCLIGISSARTHFDSGAWGRQRQSQSSTIRVSPGRHVWFRVTNIPALRTDHICISGDCSVPGAVFQDYNICVR